MTKRKKNPELYLIPNFLTTIHILFGYFSILASLHGKFQWAAFLIVISAVLDGSDGVIARLTKTQSEFGVQLDSLADTVSFGVAPSLLLYFWGFKTTVPNGAAIFFSFIFLAAGVLRLARYNILQKKKTDRKHYTGLTLPSASMVIAGIVVIRPELIQEKLFALLLASLIIILALCMVSTIQYRNYLYINFREGIDLKTALMVAILISSLVLFLKIFLVVFFSLNAVSGPAVYAFKLSKKKLPLLFSRKKPEPEEE